MSRRLKILVAVIVLILVGLLIWLLLRGKGQAPAVQPSPQAQEQIQTGPAVTAQTLPTPLGTAPAQGTQTSANAPTSLESFARSFAERYGSYSNQSNYENLKDLYTFMTVRLRNETEAYVARESANTNTSSYFGVSTRAISAKALEQTDSTAKFRLTTQRAESQSGKPAPRIYYQDIELSFLSVAGEWKVDRAEWK